MNSTFNLKYSYKNILNCFVYKNRHYCNSMNFIDLNPPQEVRGMVCLKREEFKKVIVTPQLRVNEEISNKILQFLKNHILKMEKLKPVFSNKATLNEKIILLNPLVVQNWKNLPTEELSKVNVTENNFEFGKIELSYENWRVDEIFKAILPKNELLSSYSKIGHIIHVNLRDHLWPYKQVIGEVLKDKIPGCKTVVNKSQTIDNTYRNFNLELIYGEDNYCVETKENGITYQFDFSKVYWNPRLSTEHERILKLLKPGDVLYDVFAGVGPFSIPAAKKKCMVFANDLNPESFKWLNTNISRNKCGNNIKTFNKDGRDFIIETVKEDLKIQMIQSNNLRETRIHITMNLPAMAVMFLNVFLGLLTHKFGENKSEYIFPLVHVYCFIKGKNSKSLALNYVEENAGFSIQENLEGIYFVRNVAPNKDMYRVSFYLTSEILFQKQKTQKRENSTIENTKCCKNQKLYEV